MPSETPAPRRRAGWRRPAIAVLLFAPFGGGAGLLVGRALRKATPGGLPFTWSAGEIAGVVIAALLIISGAVVVFAATSNRRWNRIVEHQQGDAPIDPGARSGGVRQAVVCILSGGMMLMPPIAVHLGWGIGARTGLAVGLMALLGVQTWINLKLWRDGDELTRTVFAATGAACFWLLQIALFGWAMLAKLTLVAEVDSWTLFTVLMGVYLIVSIVIAKRRGLVPE